MERLRVLKGLVNVFPCRGRDISETGIRCFHGDGTALKGLLYGVPMKWGRYRKGR